MKTSRFKYEYRKSASALHRKVGEILRGSHSLGLQEIYQEYPVNKVNENYEYGSHHFDWVIPKLGIVIECHGRQHYEPVAWDGDQQAAVEHFRRNRQADRLKKHAALNSGFIYVEISYKLQKNLDEAKILELIEEGKKELELHVQETERPDMSGLQNKTRTEELKDEQKQRDREQRQRYLTSEVHQERLRKAREHRRKQYRRLKELRDKDA